LDHKIWIDHILYRNCLLKYVTEGKIEWTGRSKHLLDDLKKKEEILNITTGSTRLNSVQNLLQKGYRTF